MSELKPVTSVETDWVSAAVANANEPEVRKAWTAILLLLGRLTEEERHIGRPLRGHTKIGCVCRYCKSVLGGRIVLHTGEHDE